MMKWIIILLLAYCGIGYTCTSNDTTICNVIVTKVYDGDTITVNIPGLHPIIGKKIGIRINGVDTPEIRTKDACEKTLGFKAREHVKRLVVNAKHVHLLNISRGKYFRIVADVVADGINIRMSLLNNNLAYPYDGGTKATIDWCKGLGNDVKKSTKN